MKREWPEHLTAAERTALSQFLDGARELLGEDLLAVRLFGSRARGEGGEGSDLDVALIVTEEGRKRRREVHGITFDVVYRHGIEVEPLVITEEWMAEMARRELRLGEALEREGVVL